MKYSSRLFAPATPVYRLLMFLAPVVFPCLLAAQDLHVYYDLFTDSVSYRKDNQLICDPKIRKGDFVVLHFTEFNPFLYRVETEVEQTNSESPTGAAGIGSFMSLMPGVSSLFPMLGGGAATTDSGTPPVSFLDAPLIQLGEASFKLKDLFSNSRGPEQLMQQAREQLAALTQTQEEMKEIYSEIQSLERSEKAAQLASVHLDQLLHNPRIRPSLIRKIAAEYLAIIFPEKPAAALEVADVFKWQERPATKRLLLQSLQIKQQEFDAQMLQLTPITGELSDLSEQIPALDKFTADLRNVSKKSISLRQQLEAYIEKQSKTETSDLTVEEMLALQMKFRELAEESFTYDCPVEMAKSHVIVKGIFTPIDSTGASKAAPKTKVVKLETHGGLRISTGVGVGFSRMFDPTQEFSAREDVIVVEEGGAVQPSLATFIHFYPATRSGVAVAGTFGLGIPLSGANITSLNFFLGPSLLFGRSQRIVLSGGLTAGPVQRLAKGFKAGDAFDASLGDIPTRTRYELGYFLGISFNLNGG